MTSRVWVARFPHRLTLPLADALLCVNFQRGPGGGGRGARSGLRACVCAQDGNTIAARAAQSLQIFNLELGKKIKSHKMPDDKVVQFWSWISPNTIGLITETEVFHWSIDGGCAHACRLRDVCVPVLCLWVRCVSA